MPNFDFCKSVLLVHGLFNVFYHFGKSRTFSGPISKPRISNRPILGFCWQKSSSYCESYWKNWKNNLKAIPRVLCLPVQTPSGTRRLRGTLSFRNDNIHFVVLREGLEARLRRVDDNIGRVYCVANDEQAHTLVAGHSLLEI